jgi:hypothetical protein
LPALFTTKSTGHRALHQTSAEVGSSREGTLGIIPDFAFRDRIAALCLCIV